MNDDERRNRRTIHRMIKAGASPEDLHRLIDETVIGIVHEDEDLATDEDAARKRYLELFGEI